MKTNVDFEAHDNAIKEILFSQYPLQVPRYQRPYAWDIDQISDFWDDTINSKNTTFIGSIILNTESIEKTGYFEIIDGQQRLLTISIFIAVLRDIAKNIDIEVAKRYQRQDIAMEDRSGKPTYRIIPGDGSKDFFVKHVQDFQGNILAANSQTVEENRIKKNYEFFYNKVKDDLKKFTSKADQIKYLDDLRERIANLTVIQISIDNEEAAYEIFETTNARGVDLSVADLLKNLIFKELPPKEDKDFAREIWDDMTDNVDELKKFIRYYWISRHGLVSSKRLFREIKKETVDYKALIEDMWDSSGLYYKIVLAASNEWDSYKSGDKIFKSIFGLRIMNVSQCYTLLMSLLRNIEAMKTDPYKVFELIERFTFQYSAVCKLPTNRLEKFYGKYAAEIEEVIKKSDSKHVSGNIQSLFAELEKELKLLIPSKDHFESEFMNISYRNSEQSRKLIKYVLGKIDGYYRQTKEETIDFDNVNVEHLLPQKPDNKWGVNKQDIKEYVNSLGNLTLVDKSINSKIGNKPMKEKIKILKLSGLPINRPLIDELTNNNNIWNRDLILKRQIEFAKLAYTDIWKI